MHVSRADLVLDQVVPEPHIVEVGRYEHRRVPLLGPQQLRQHRAHEILEARIVLGGRRVTRDTLKHLKTPVKRFGRFRDNVCRRWGWGGGGKVTYDSTLVYGSRIAGVDFGVGSRFRCQLREQPKRSTGA